jgi:predicted short-subunit dehydrogenase-like oxidoreductase (DUF2520 family)
MHINIIGAGRLGKNLARALVTQHNVDLVVCNSHLESSKIAAKAIGYGYAVANLAELPPADITFITTPDDEIQFIIEQLLQMHRPAHIISHCSGVYSSQLLKPLQNQNHQIVSIHPLKAFRSNHIEDNAFSQCDCVIEGDSLAVETLSRLFTTMNANILTINAAKKHIYHAAAVMASNYIVTLAACARTLMQQSGLTPTEAQQITQNLMQQSLNNLKQTTDVKNALTGPLARGDIKTIATHLSAITEPNILELYQYAGLATLPLTQLDDDRLKALTQQLRQDA